jgi:hypothetical protein
MTYAHNCKTNLLGNMNTQSRVTSSSPIKGNGDFIYNNNSKGLDYNTPYNKLSGML